MQSMHSISLCLCDCDCRVCIDDDGVLNGHRLVVFVVVFRMRSMLFMEKTPGFVEPAQK